MYLGCCPRLLLMVSIPELCFFPKIPKPNSWREAQFLKGGRLPFNLANRDAQWDPGAKQPSIFHGSCYLQTKLIKSPTLTPSNLFYLAEKYGVFCAKWKQQPSEWRAVLGMRGHKPPCRCPAIKVPATSPTLATAGHCFPSAFWDGSFGRKQSTSCSGSKNPCPQ